MSELDSTQSFVGSRPISFAGRGLLLDIEGTVAPVSYVTDVLFPYAKQHLASYLRKNWDSAEVEKAKELIARDAGAESFAKWRFGATSQTAALDPLCNHLNKLMISDAKATGLKELQGLIWRDGFQSGELKSVLYADVAPHLKTFAAAGLDIRIFSSGSIAAQKLFFKHTRDGDLSGCIRGNYDTTIGPKREPKSYELIAAQFELPPSEILFLSDILAELDAARTAGMQTALAIRPGNAPIAAEHTHPTFFTLRDFVISLKK